MNEPIAESRSRELAAKAWVEVGALLDLQLSPLGLLAIDALSLKRGEAVVDIGCGAGQSTLQLADRVGPEGRVTGIDIAPQLLEVARTRAVGLGQVRFIEGDAQTVSLPNSGLDAAFSRFGVMAFADPRAAFANFHRMLKPLGRLAFVCWRGLDENQLDLLPLRAAGLEGRADLTPFSFADPVYLRETVEGAGFHNVKVQARDQKVSSGDIDAMATVLLKVGPLGKILRETPRLRGRAEAAVRKALARHVNQGQVALNAAIWIVTAVA